MSLINPRNSYEALLQKLQEIYQQQTENKNVNQRQSNNLDVPPLEFNNNNGQVLMCDSGNINVKPVQNNPYSATGPGVMMPTDLNFTYTQVFKIPQQYLGYLGFENYWTVTSPNVLSAGFIYQVESWSLPVYEIIGDGTTVWLGQQPPTNYMSRLTFAQAKQGLYYAPRWKVKIPAQLNRYAPPAGTYDVIGFVGVNNIVPLNNPTGSFHGCTKFYAGTVTNISPDGQTWTGGGFLDNCPGMTTVAYLMSLPPLLGVASFTTSGQWPQPWQDPNHLGPGGGGPGIPAIPGQVVEYTGPSGQAIYQPASDLEFITYGTLFQGVTYEARFPRTADFTNAGVTLAGAITAFNQLQDGQFWNDLGGGTFTNNFGSTRAPGDLMIYGVSPADLNLIFQTMWTAYRAGGSPSWAHIGSATSGGSPIQSPICTITYGVSQTWPQNEMRAIILNSTGAPGGEHIYMTGDYRSINWGDWSPTPTAANYVDQMFQTSGWTFYQDGYQVFYDEGGSTPLFIQNASSPNIGRPDQHQAFNDYLLKGSSLYDNPSVNIACAFYWFNFTNVTLIVNPDPYPKAVTANTCSLDNTFDPVFIKQSKSTDDEERWGVIFYYSAIVCSPSVKKNDLTFPKWTDTTTFAFATLSNGYNFIGQEGNAGTNLDIGVAQKDFSYPDRTGPIKLVSGPALYSDSIPNSSLHNTQTKPNYGPQLNDVQTRVKAYLRVPLNWHKVNKYDTQGELI